MDGSTLPLPGLSPVARRAVKACFDGGSLSPDAGVLVLREVERRLGVAECQAGCLDDPREPALITHTLADMVRFRMLMIVAGYEDGNDATSLRLDRTRRLGHELDVRLMGMLFRWHGQYFLVEDTMSTCIAHCTIDYSGAVTTKFERYANMTKANSS